jgi:hypothetical protein
MAIPYRLDDGKYVLARNFKETPLQGAGSTREELRPAESFECWTGSGWSYDQDQCRRFLSQQEALDFLALGVIDPPQ